MHGRSVYSDPPAPAPPHTSSEQWQSFEVRMRQRRAERCLQRATAALQAGLLDDARKACADVREMDPAHPALAAVEEGIAALAAKRSSPRLGAIAAAIAAAVFSVSMIWYASSGPDAPQPRQPESARGDIVLAAPTTIVPPTKPVEPTRPEPTPEPAASRIQIAQSEPARPQAPAEVRSTPANRIPLEVVSTLPPESLPVPPAPAPAPAAAPEPAPAVSAPPAEPERVSPAASAPTGNDARSDVRADVAVRRTLARYEAAYSNLDVSAARAVWPTVDQRALARAFDGLASQRISLNDCDVVVTGATARATCSGAATWTAKVGGQQDTQARRWSFELRDAAGSWQIVRAEAR
jgi:hypothetical protein